MNQSKKCTVVRYCLMMALLGLAHVTHALPFSILPSRPLPTTVTLQGAVRAEYTVTNNTRVQRDGNIVQWLPPNTTVENTGCGARFNLAPGAHCILRLKITGAVNAKDSNPHHHLFVCFPEGKTCAGTAYPLNVSVGTRVQYAYVANASGNTISRCKTTTDNSLSDCISQSDPTFNMPADIILNQDASIAYVANMGSTQISQCSVNLTDGSLRACELSDPIYPAHGNPGLALVNNILYATDYLTSIVYACPVKKEGALETCASNFGDGTFVAPNGRVAFNAAGTLAYVPNYWSTNTVSICHAGADGALSACVSHADPAIFKPQGAFMNPLGNYLYIANGANDNHVVICPVKSDGSLSPCTGVTDPTFALGDYQLNLFVSRDQYLYVPNPTGGLGGTTLSICPILGNGLLGPCTSTPGNGTFYGLTSAWITFSH